jgi:hypothetical protein
VPRFEKEDFFVDGNTLGSRGRMKIEFLRGIREVVIDLCLKEN